VDDKDVFEIPKDLVEQTRKVVLLEQTRPPPDPLLRLEERLQQIVAQQQEQHKREMQQLQEMQREQHEREMRQLQEVLEGFERREKQTEAPKGLWMFMLFFSPVFGFCFTFPPHLSPYSSLSIPFPSTLSSSTLASVFVLAHNSLSLLSLIVFFDSVFLLLSPYPPHPLYLLFNHQQQLFFFCSLSPRYEPECRQRPTSSVGREEKRDREVCARDLSSVAVDGADQPKRTRQEALEADGARGRRDRPVLAAPLALSAVGRFDVWRERPRGVRSVCPVLPLQPQDPPRDGAMQPTERAPSKVASTRAVPTEFANANGIKGPLWKLVNRKQFCDYLRPKAEKHASNVLNRLCLASSEEESDAVKVSRESPL